jgi:gliding motility-associated-like protein
MITRYLLLFSIVCVVFKSNCFGQNAGFAADVTSGCFPLTVNFSDASTGTISSRSWNFGNNNTSDLLNPSAVYSSPGVYTVSLTVFNSSQQSDTETKTGYIVVHDYPNVNFSFDKNEGCSPLTVKFNDITNGSSGTITNWFWVFGDGGTSIERNPTHIYTGAGSKSVSLKLKNEFGCEFTKVIASAITVEGPSARFSASSILVCQVPATIQFTNLSSGNGTLSYLWSFGDGGTDTSTNPSHTFTRAGSYNVILIARDSKGCENSYSVEIGAGSAGGLNFQPSATRACVNQDITFSVQSNLPVVSSSWDFGNSTTSSAANPTISYTTAGNYTVTLNALLQGNTCSSIVTKTIELTSVEAPTFTHQSDCNSNVTFTSTSVANRVEWYIQGALRSTQKSFVYSFGAPGSQKITLIAYNELNCSKTLEKNIVVTGKPTAFFLPYPEQHCTERSLSGCAPFSLQLTNSSASQSAFTSMWNFGDGQTSTENDPLHIYTAKGNYTLTLTITNVAGCTSTTSAKVMVADVKPTANFSPDKTSVCVKEVVRFINQTVNATFWCWDFGDGTTTTGNNISHAYTKPGIYTVKLTAKNAGCTDTFQIVDAIEVKNPFVDFEIGKTCSDPFTVNLKNLSLNYTSLQWDFGDGASSSTDVLNHQYQNVGNYTIRLTGVNTSTNCTVEKSIPVLIQKIKADFEIDNVKPCMGAPVRFTDKSTAAIAWSWSFSNNQFSSLQHPSTSYSRGGVYQVSLTAYDSDGCSNQKTVPITALGIANNFSFTASSNCDELTVQFKDNSIATPPISSREWSFGDGETSALTNPSHVYRTLKNYAVTLTVTNAEGTCSLIKYDAVRFTNPVPDFSILKSTFCIGEQLRITNTSQNAIRFVWELGNDRVSNDLHPFVSYSTVGKYTIKLSATDTYGCTKDLTKTDYVSIDKPTAAFAAFETSGECPPLTTIFQDKSLGRIQKWQWNFGDGNSSVLLSPANTYLKAGTFDVKLTVTDVNGCTDMTTALSLVQVGGPSGKFRSDATANLCLGKTINFVANTNNTVIHRWDFGDGTVEDKSIMEARHLYTKSGRYTTALVLIDEKGCKVVAEGSEAITLKDTTAINFEYSPNCLFEGDQFQLQASPEKDISTWSWEVNGNTLGTDPKIQLSADTADTYQVTLRAFNKQGCPSYVSGQVPVNGNLSFIPNVFTPNNDGHNDFFEIKDLEKSKWDIKVYNRWGDQVYEKQSYASDWAGRDMSSGVYYYYITNSFCRNKTYKGFVSIIR